MVERNGDMIVVGASADFSALLYTCGGNPASAIEGLNADSFIIDDPGAPLIELPHDVSMAELGCKAAASILLSKAGSRRIVVPSCHERFGVGLLERDGELKRARK
jgi:hypothetical protein